MKAIVLFSLIGMLLLFNCSNNQEAVVETISETQKEPSTKIELGEKLFFEDLLSLDESINCATCHIPEFAFADTTPFSIGIEGRLGKRNTPSAMNMHRDIFFYDGRAATLEKQAVFPIEDHLEMSLPIDEAISRLRSNSDYVKWFNEIYGEAITIENMTNAIAEFERSLETSNTPFDRYMAGDESAISESAKRGHNLFNADKSKCFDCHFGPDFTGDEFRNIGLYDEVKYKDKGRFNETNNALDLGKFKVPGLRNIAITSPYMHDGSFKTLKEVLEFYNDPYKFVEDPINLDSIMIKPLGLTNQELEDLENFLHTLTDDRFEK